MQKQNNENNKSLSSLETFSIKLTENNIPSNGLIKQSQDNISLTYTISLENISQQLCSLKNINNDSSIQGINDVSITRYNGNQDDKLSIRKGLFKESPIDRQNLKNHNLQNIENLIEKQKDFFNFKKKSILKISNIDLGIGFRQNNGKENQYSPQTTGIKGFIDKKNRNFNISKICNSNNNENQILIQSKNYSISKEINMHGSADSFGESLLLRTKKFHSLKQDKVIEPIVMRKKSITVNKRQTIKSKQPQTYSTQRKSIHTKLPMIKHSLNRNINCSSVTTRKKSYTSYNENVQLINDKNYGTFNQKQKILFGKSCKINENDQKVKKYLKKIIQTRQSIMHFTDNIRNIQMDF